MGRQSLKSEFKPEMEKDANDASSGTNLVSLYKTMLRIIDHLDGGVATSAKAEYSDDQLRQTAEVELDDPADPASDDDTRRAETHFTPLSD
jgi:hypothetical protein